MVEYAVVIVGIAFLARPLTVVVIVGVHVVRRLAVVVVSVAVDVAIVGGADRVSVRDRTQWADEDGHRQQEQQIARNHAHGPIIRHDPCIGSTRVAL